MKKTFAVIAGLFVIAISIAACATSRAGYETAPYKVIRTEGAGRVWEAEVACLVEHDLTLHAAGDVVVVVRSVGTSDDGARVLETTGLDAATGALLWERRAPREEALVRPVGGLLLAVRPPEGLVRPTSQVSLVGARDA